MFTLRLICPLSFPNFVELGSKISSFFTGSNDADSSKEKEGQEEKSEVQL